MKDRLLKQFREAVAKKKEQIHLEFENRFLSTNKEKIISDKTSVAIKDRVYVPDPQKEEKLGKSKTLLEVSSENRELNKKMESFSLQNKIKDGNGSVIKNLSIQDVDQIHSDDAIVKTLTELKNQRHITKVNSKGSNLDEVHDEMFDVLTQTRDTLRDPKDLNQLQKVIEDSLEVSEARGIVFNSQNIMFSNYHAVNPSKFEALDANAVSLTENLKVDLESSPDAKVICHSSLYTTTSSTFTNSTELAVAKNIAKTCNTTVFVTGDASLDDPEVMNFIGNRRLIILDSAQVNFDYYMYATTLEGEQVVIRADLKSRPLERVDNLGEINNSDSHTFMYVGKVSDVTVKNKKIESFCDKAISKLHTEINELKNQPGAFHDDLIRYKILTAELQILQLETMKISHDLKDLDSYHGVKPIFYDFIKENSNTEDQIDWFDPSLDSSKIIDD